MLVSLLYLTEQMMLAETGGFKKKTWKKAILEAVWGSSTFDSPFGVSLLPVAATQNVSFLHAGLTAVTEVTKARAFVLAAMIDQAWPHPPGPLRTPSLVPGLLLVTAPLNYLCLHLSTYSY